MTFILIVLFARGTAATTSVEFNTKEACEVAGLAVEQKAREASREAYWTCQPKGK